jgi:hypothetical protein
MKIKGTVKALKNSERLPNASIEVKDKDGKTVGGTVANVAGEYELELPELSDPKTKVIFSSVGYYEQSLSPSSASGDVYLYTADDMLSPYFIVARVKKHKNDIVAVSLFAIVVTILLTLYFKYVKI